ncbi:CRISPR-associated Cas1 family protein [Anaerobacterium chartisolvens]|uniref:CRISPR-associated endonuclease Cas1 n=1 Tax=Anaerobacterium chartisolvens TaxID=1297424 RepID=A0A369BHR7_9FIRM|nr:type I-C CRISPR-associated endonuclease Cas1c [Anaerobacterium chartisolvens]RCX20106.1 CRISPR-associated Cas1 family protein [Anaerobacterium chartisolvens]
MRKLLNTLYIITPDNYLALDGETVLIRKNEETVKRLPLHNLEAIVTFGYTGASPALMGACAKRSIDLSFLTPSGRFLARVVGESRGNVTLRKEQYRISDSEEKSCAVARNFIIGKIYNAKWILERAARDHGMRLDAERLKKVSSMLTKKLEEVVYCGELEQLRGIEGNAANMYFGEFDGLILQQRESFYFNGRNKRPPTDNVNALLSFTYTLLARDCAAALEAVGLDAYVGFLHRDRPGRASLALDLMEELRCLVADRFVLSLINKKAINGEGFVKRENGAVIMEDETRKTVLAAWQERKREQMTHPFLDEKVEWGLVPYVQATLLARFLRGDLDEYPPLMWK